MGIKAIIFDLDGTLVDSIDDLADSMNTVLREMKFPEHPVSSYYTFVGMGIRKLVVDALPVFHRDEKTVEECFERMTQLYEQNINNKTRLYPGIEEMLDSVVKNGVSISVLSNKADNLTKKVVYKVLKKWNFDFVMGPGSDSKRKPNPENVLHISTSLGVDPTEVAYVGDTGTDMKTANKADMLAVGVLWGFRSEKELRENGADKIIETPKQLSELVLSY